jgi:hypothetical protein
MRTVLAVKYLLVLVVVFSWFLADRKNSLNETMNQYYSTRLLGYLL